MPLLFDRYFASHGSLPEVLRQGLEVKKILDLSIFKCLSGSGHKHSKMFRGLGPSWRAGHAERDRLKKEQPSPFKGKAVGGRRW